MDADTINWSRIFLPYFNDERDYLARHKVRLAYYCKCDVAEKIITNQEFWLRDSQLMNDSAEIVHGIKLIDEYFADAKKGGKFVQLLDTIAPGAAQAALAEYEEWKTVRRAETFLMSFSRHAPPNSKLAKNEDQHGRLSMWRGYGDSEGVAMVFNVPLDQISDGNLIFFLSPVGYFGSIDAQIRRVKKNVAKQRDFLKSMPYADLCNAIFVMLIAAATCLKHPGFMEEDEWRLLYLPSTWKSALVLDGPDDVGGKLERVCKIPLSAFKRAGITGMDLDVLIDRIIVGPTKNPDKILDTIVDALTKQGVVNPKDRVRPSGIPFRSTG